MVLHSNCLQGDYFSGEIITFSSGNTGLIPLDENVKVDTNRGEETISTRIWEAIFAGNDDANRASNEKPVSI